MLLKTSTEVVETDVNTPEADFDSLPQQPIASQSLNILLPENIGAKLLSVAPRNVADLLDTVTGCKVFDSVPMRKLILLF